MASLGLYPSSLLPVATLGLPSVEVSFSVGLCGSTTPTSFPQSQAHNPLLAQQSIPLPDWG